MGNYKLPLMVLGAILIVIGLFLFNSLKVIGVISLIVGSLALIKAFTLKSVEKEEKIEPEKDSDKEVEEEQEDGESEDEDNEDKEEEPEEEEDTKLP